MKIIIQDESLMVEKHIFFDYLNLTLQPIKGNSLPARRIPKIASGDFLQWNPVMGRGAFQSHKNNGYRYAKDSERDIETQTLSVYIFIIQSIKLVIYQIN